MFTHSEVIDTWNGTATVHVKPSDSDLAQSVAEGLMNGSYKIQQWGDVFEIIGTATCGKRFKRGEISFADPEAQTNYLIDFAV